MQLCLQGNSYSDWAQQWFRCTFCKWTDFGNWCRWLCRWIAPALKTKGFFFCLTLSLWSKYILHNVTAKGRRHQTCLVWFPVSLAFTVLFMLPPVWIFRWEMKIQFTAQKKCISHRGTKTGRGNILPSGKEQIGITGNSPLQKTRKVKEREGNRDITRANGQAFTRWKPLQRVEIFTPVDLCLPLSTGLKRVRLGVYSLFIRAMRPDFLGPGC